ncbi:MAG: hypothetical protein HUJ30_08430, partial [Gammaproteobacteria bacterium]|nr:hypothetical protein [Gammaproteobacteria bacterium]
MIQGIKQNLLAILAVVIILLLLIVVYQGNKIDTLSISISEKKAFLELKEGEASELQKQIETQ